MAAVLGASIATETNLSSEEPKVFDITNPYTGLENEYKFAKTLSFNSPIYIPSSHPKQKYSDHKRAKNRRINKKLRPNSYK